MAPMVSMVDFPMPRTDAAYPHTKRRQRRRLVGEIGLKYRTIELRQLSAARARVVETSQDSTPQSNLVTDSDSSTNDNCFESSLSAKIQNNSMKRDDRWIILKRRQGLLNNLVRTIDLVRRNYILEKKLEALIVRLETRKLINSVINNPENRLRNERIRESTFKRDETILNDYVTSTSNEKSGWSRSELVRQRVEEWRRNLIENQSFVTSTLDPLSPDTMIR